MTRRVAVTALHGIGHVAARIGARDILALVAEALVALGEGPLEQEPTNVTQGSVSSHAMRQRRYRERLRSVTRDVTQDVSGDASPGDVTPLALSSLSSSSDFKLSSEIPDGSSMSTGAGASAEVTPDPHESRTQPVAKRARSERGTRIPSAADGDEVLRSWCAMWRIDMAHPEFPKFRNHFRATPSGKGGVKLDWPATWDNWLRRAGDAFAPRGQAQSAALPYHPDPAPRRRTDGMRCELHGSEACPGAKPCPEWRLRPANSDGGPVSMRRMK